jgi:hypothetical protein
MLRQDVMMQTNANNTQTIPRIMERILKFFIFIEPPLSDGCYGEKSNECFVYSAKIRTISIFRIVNDGPVAVAISDGAPAPRGRGFSLGLRGL